jgi:hypothetical protein
MHEAEPYGHLLVNGKQVSEGQLAALTGIPAREAGPLLAQLEDAGVFTRTDEGVITSRCMVRDAVRSAEGARTGKLGGNPTLKGGVKGEDKGADNAPDNAEDNAEDNGGPSPRSQRPESRIQNQKDPDFLIYEDSPSAFLDEKPQGQSLAPPRRARRFGEASPWTPEQKRAAWQSRVCTWAQAELSIEAYANFLEGWANGERWAQLKAEEFSAAMNAARSRKAQERT